MDSLRRWQRGDISQIGVRFSQRGDELIDLRDDRGLVVAALLSDGRSLRLGTLKFLVADNTAAG